MTAPTDPRVQTLGEEIANSVSHGLGLLAAIAVTPVLIVKAVQLGNTGLVVGSSLFGACLILLYLASTLYHALPRGKAKEVFQILEHAAIFLLIAGSYSPFTLGILPAVWGWSLFGTIWGLALGGVVLKAVTREASPVLSAILYLTMGWLIALALGPLSQTMTGAGIAWLVAGGLAYTLGVPFFALDARLRYSHFIWHLFVLTGSGCHVAAVLGYGG